MFSSFVLFFMVSVYPLFRRVSVITSQKADKIPERAKILSKKQSHKTISYRCFRMIRWLIDLFYPKVKLEGLEHIPQEPCLLVGNHCQMHGPILAELRLPGKRAIWCAGAMMELKEVPSYAYADFWCHKPRWSKWFYKLLSYLIAPVSVCVFNHARTIPVYRDGRIMMTFRRSVQKLEEGANVVVFPECPEDYNGIIQQFQEGFADVARLYYKRTGKELQLVPMYMAPKLKKVCFGPPVRYCAANPREEERTRLCRELMEAVTALAVAQPPHTVVPYNNISKRLYPTNVPKEVPETLEKTGC